MPPPFHPLAHIFPSRPNKRLRSSFCRRNASAERIPLVPVTAGAGSSEWRESFSSDSSTTNSSSNSPSPLSTLSHPPSPGPRPPFSRTPSASSTNSNAAKSPTGRMSRLSLTSVATVVAVLGLLGDNGLSSLGIVGVGARAVPYTTFEERGGRSPWEGERMREVEGLRVRGVSEKEIAAHFSTPHPRTLAYPHPVVARSADPESAPAPVVSAEMKTRFESFLQRMLERIGVKAAEQAADVAGIERKMDGSSVAVGMVVRAEEQREGLEELVEKRGEVEERDATAEMRKQGEVHAREEMKQWLQTRDAEIEGVGAVEERGEEKEARAEGAEGVEMAVVVNSVIAMGEGMAEKRDEEKDEEMPELQVQKRDAEEVVKNALEEWRRGIKERSAGAGEEAGAALEKRSIALDAEDGGLEVRGQMGRLKAVQV